ncbi:hypothetical protein GOP47_0021338, partial [Adiantum capillus-veneris]
TERRRLQKCSRSRAPLTPSGSSSTTSHLSSQRSLHDQLIQMWFHRHLCLALYGLLAPACPRLAMTLPDLNKVC